VAFIRSSIKPPDNVPNIPQTIVIAPNNISALVCKLSSNYNLHQGERKCPSPKRSSPFAAFNENLGQIPNSPKPSACRSTARIYQLYEQGHDRRVGEVNYTHILTVLEKITFSFNSLLKK